MCLLSKLHLLFIITLILSLESLGKHKQRKYKEGKVKEEKCLKCGRRIPALEGFRINDRIIDGRKVNPPFKYPWIVKVEADHSCGGSIITRRYILTSAFCLTRTESDSCRNRTLPKRCYVNNKDVKIRLPWRDSARFRKTLLASKLLPHPEYDPECKTNDIALVRLSQDLKCNSFKQPICLPTSDLSRMGGKLVITGWGQVTADGTLGSRVLREGEMMQIAFENCNIYQCFDKNKAICAVGTHKHQTPCKGDSGGSTFADFNKSYYALGITSLPHSFLCQPSQPITYTKVKYYIDWIKRYVRKLPVPYGVFVRIKDLEIDNEPYEN